MKKFSLFGLGLVFALTLSSCGVSSKINKVSDTSVSDSIVNKELPKVSEKVDSEKGNKEEEKESVILTKKKKDSMNANLKKQSYISVSQTMTNGSKENKSASSETTYSIQVDTKSKISSLTIGVANDVSNKDSERVSYDIMSDAKKDITVIKNQKTNKWVEADGKYKVLAWDVSKFNNAKDIWSHLLNDADVKAGTKGYKIGDYEYYEVSTKANDKMLTGLKYDKLGDMTTSYIFRRESGVLIPCSFTVDIQYFIGDAEYYVRANIKLDSLGNSTIAFPKYKKTGKFKKSDK